MAVFALVAAGGITAGLTQVANAQTSAVSCSPPAAAAQATCTTDTVTINNPTAITLDATLASGDATQTITLQWEGDCAQGSNDQPINSTSSTPTAISTTADAIVSVPFPSGMTDPDFCDITTEGTLSGTGDFTLNVDYTPNPNASPTTSTSSPSPVSVPLIKGYGGKCVDDKGNSSSNKTEVIIWTCNSGDSAQGWTYTNGELQHNGKCANDQGNGGSGSKVILWSCNGASNETWFHSGSDGEFVLSLSSHGILCLDDPGYSTTNRTQLIVYACHNGSNQHWT